MFYYLNGELVLTEPNAAVLDVGGVAYRLTISGTTLHAIAGKSEKVRLYTYLKVSEDAVELFGFASLEEMEIFKALLSVSGVGPKAAISVLNLYTSDQLRIIIANEDSKAIAKAQNVGAKTAARIVLDLRDKLKLHQQDISADSADPTVVTSGAVDEALNALLVLGYTRSEALTALRGAPDGLTLEEYITRALKQLAKQ